MSREQFVHDAVEIVNQYRKSIREDFEAIPEDRIWNRPVPGQVSPANLLLHLTGNLRHFFGHLLGGTGYRRDRDREFLPEPYATGPEILAGWEIACDETTAALKGLDEGALDAPAPVESWPGGTTVSLFVMRLLAHLAYHAGQVRSHYRMLVDPD